MKHPRLADDVAPNLVPMVDIMFLLLLFFMLSADMGQRELEAVKLPLALAATPDKDAELGIPRLTINGYHRPDLACGPYDLGGAGVTCREDEHWRIGINGEDFKVDRLAERLKKEAGGVPASERPVMLRVDSGAPYGLAQRIMNTCAKAGLYKIEVGAAKESDPR